MRYPQEYDFSTWRTDFGQRIVKNAVVPKNGLMAPPEGPGLGMELNQAEVAKLAAKS